MPKKEVPLTFLKNYVPKGSIPLICEYLKKYSVHLTITKSRKTVLGDYRHANGAKNHRISINGNLNQYAFLITLIHELAHLITFIQLGNNVASHGKEWKDIYRQLLLNFVIQRVFPDEVREALERSLHNLPASSCTDEQLGRVLKNYNINHTGLLMVEQLSEGELFAMEGGKIFKKGKQLRKRFQCTELKSGKLYLFSPIYEVKPFIK